MFKKRFGLWICGLSWTECKLINQNHIYWRACRAKNVFLALTLEFRISKCHRAWRLLRTVYRKLRYCYSDFQFPFWYSLLREYLLKIADIVSNRLFDNLMYTVIRLRSLWDQMWKWPVMLLPALLGSNLFCKTFLWMFPRPHFPYSPISRTQEI